MSLRLTINFWVVFIASECVRRR